MKRNNIFKVFAVMALLATGLTSCNDFLTIYPTDKTIGEDFWKTKQDVQNMVTGAYGSIISYGCQEKAIVWGGFRSDELVKYSSCINTSLDNINAVKQAAQNGFFPKEIVYANKVAFNIKCAVILDDITQAEKQREGI